MSGHLQRINSEIVEIPDFEGFGVIGDPGCDGLGTYNLKLFSGALKECSDLDFILVVGDLVPTGHAKYYDTVTKIIENKSAAPVYVLPGNHDTGEYEKNLGRTEYTLVSSGKAIVVLNNMFRKFNPDGLLMLRNVLEREDIHTVFIAFHIPLPNNFIGNSVSAEEAEALYNAISSHKEKVKCFICGHVHSRFEDNVLGIPLVCTGGGGAMIEDVSENIKATDINHHVVRFSADGAYQIKDIVNPGISDINSILKDRIEESIKNELLAHLKYKIDADRAANRGLENTARLFMALAESEYQHARNFYSLLDSEWLYGKTLKDFVKTEEYEYSHIYKMTVDYCRENEKDLSAISFESALAAEKEHAKLLKRLDAEKDYDGKNLYVCPICGFIMEGDNPPDRCPVCGRPSKEFDAYEMTVDSEG